MAASPGKVDGEAAEQVEEGPGQDDDVVDVQEDDNHLGRVADACSGKPQNWAREGALTRPPAQLRRGLRSTLRALRQCWAQAPSSLISLPGR